MVKSPITREDKNDKYYRTSKTCFFTDVGIQNNIEDKILNMIQISEKNSEKSQIQHYLIGNEFKEHYDYFHEGYDTEYLKDGQRTWTFMIYLNDVKKGGETKFIKLNETIYPKKGSAVIWCNLDKKGNPDSNTLHQGSPVYEGDKWIVTKWFRHKL